MDLGSAVVTAQADAWAAEGRLREPAGGGSAEFRGVRVMSSGLPYAKWNSADLLSADADLDAVRRWYAGKGVPWGIRVPVGIDPVPGRYLFCRRYLGLRPAGFVPGGVGVQIQRAGPGDAQAVAAVDAAAFGDEPAHALRWLEPQLSHPGWQVYLATVGDRPVGVATATLTDDRAGPAVAISGVGVLEGHRRTGIGLALSSRAVQDGFRAGARLAHLSPDTDAAAAVYARLGFVEVPGCNIYTDC